MMTLDGAMGEGGGQILRTALALSMVTGQPFRIDNLRAGRPKPGLMRQHLTAVTAAARVCGAHTRAAELRSTTLEFHPGTIQAGDFHFSIGSAGSVTLVLQTILPALLQAGTGSTVILEGGTHNPFAPPFDFLDKCFLPLVNDMGPQVVTRLERPGFYPAGGGRLRVAIEPVKQLKPLHLTEMGEILKRSGRVLIAGLPSDIGQRQIEVLTRRTGWDSSCFSIDTYSDEQGPGNVVILELQSRQITEVLTGFGQKGITSEAVVERLVGDMRHYLAARVPVGHYLADQILVPMAMAGGGSFLTMSLSRHAQTNIEVIRRFLPIGIHVESLRERTALVRIG